MTETHADVHPDAPEVPREDHYFYLYETGADEDPLFGFWREHPDGREECLYDRPPESGKWLSPSMAGKGYEPVPVSTHLERLLGHVAAFPEDDLPVTPVLALNEDYEQFFAQLVHGTIDQPGAELPPEMWAYIEACRDTWCVDGESTYVCIDCGYEFIQPTMGNLGAREMCPKCGYEVFERL